MPDRRLFEIPLSAEEKGERDQIEDRQGGGQGDPFWAQYRRPRLRF